MGQDSVENRNHQGILRRNGATIENLVLTELLQQLPLDSLHELAARVSSQSAFASLLPFKSHANASIWQNCICIPPPNCKGYLGNVVFSLPAFAVQEGTGRKCWVPSNHIQLCFSLFQHLRTGKSTNMIAYGLLTNTDWAKGPYCHPGFLLPSSTSFYLEMEALWTQ